MKKFSKALAMLLALCMVVGLLPVSVLAASETVLDAAIFCSDVHGSTSDLTSVLEGVKTSGVDYSSIGFVGDTCLTVANTTSTVQNALGDTDIDVMFSYAASHDTENSADISTNWNYSGEVEWVSDDYLVYTIRETDMQNASDAATAAPAFTTWYNDLTDAQKALPIFIMSHRPLHDRRDDNAGAATWYSAISAAAESSDIVFFWGHNHTSENDVDIAAYYVAKDGDETFTVYNGDTVTPNFTYMNAGYINANGQNPARKGVATTVQITAGSLVFQDYNSSGKYTDSSYSHNVTVAREFAAEEVTLSSIAISGTTSYYVGDALALTVTATYSDGTTADVTDDATLSGYDMNTAGTYTVKAEYEGMTAEYTIIVSAPQPTENTVSCDATYNNTANGDTVSATGLGLTGITATWSDSADKAAASTFSNGVYKAYDIALTGYTENDTVTVTMELLNMETTGLVLYSVAADGTLTKIEPTNVAAGDNSAIVTFTMAADSIAVVCGVPGVSIPDGATLDSLTLNGPTKKLYFLSQDTANDGNVYLDITGLEVTANYTYNDEPYTKPLEWNYFDETVDGYALNFGNDLETPGEKTITVSYGGVETTFNVWVCAESVTDSATDVAIAFNTECVVGVEISVANSTEEEIDSVITNAVSGLLDEGFLVYDITPAYAADLERLEGTATVTLPIPEGVTNPVVCYVSDEGDTVEEMDITVDAENGTVSFTTTHFSIYVVGDAAEEAEKDLTLGSDETKTVYVLVSTPTAGKQYIIASLGSAGSAYALKQNTTTGSSVEINAATATIAAPYIETDDSTIMWDVTSGLVFKSGNYYLTYSSGQSGTVTFSTSESVNWSADTSSIYVEDGPFEKHVYCNNGTWALYEGNNTAYFYEKQTVTVDSSVNYKVVASNIEHIYDSDANTAETETLAYELQANGKVVSFDGEVWNVAVVSDPNGILDTENSTNETLYFTGNTGTARVRVYYQLDANGDGDVTDDDDYKVWTTITVTAKAPYYSLDLCEPVTDAEGNTTYEPITAPVALKGIEAGNTYSVWAVIKVHTSDNPDGEDLGDVEDNRIKWSVSDTGIATIDSATGEITFTGKEYGTFTVTAQYLAEDGKTVLAEDTITISVTESLYVVPGDGTDDFPEYPNEGAVRFDKTATAVGNFSETGIAQVELSMTGVPYTTGAAIDVLLMLDMSTSMDTEVEDGVDRVKVTIAAAKAFAKTIVQNDDGTYNSNKIAIKYFNGSSVYTTTDYITVSSDEELEALYTLIEGLYTPSDSGTYYSTAMKDAYDTIIAQDAVSDNTQALVFMSDGGPTYYTYVNGNSYSTVSDDAATIVGWFDVDDNDTEDETDDTATPNSSFKTEYYSYLLKQAGYPIYTVGLGLANNSTGPQAFTALTSGAHEAITSYILSQMATSSSYFYSIADEDATANMGNIFSGIAASIKEAAKDVVVEDKIGGNYTVNFSLPNGITSDATDGLNEFYIQVVDYVLDTTTHERTGVYTVLENFTFNADGTLKSHTVDGAACGDTCSHVTITNGVVTAIDGTYFDYEVKADGEYLTWEAEKLTSTELALQYFAYLDNSAGTDVGDQIPAGTYYTNEYATLTYTNYNGNQVQQEFPVPQMTWNGAQVSYVFYLVNEAGQPVNRAGRVVPFAEAVYVTDVETSHVIWNDLEQSAGLEAEYLAKEKVPDVYTLYDDDASYNIHVYEDENEVNLNNHFVIGGDVTDTYNTDAGRTNAKTTYVFNTKADAAKYNVVSTYVADDGDEDGNESNLSYFCKSAAIEGATFTTAVENEVTVYTVTDLGNGYQAVSGETQATVAQIMAAGGSITGGTIIGDYIYYVDENEAVYTIVQKTDGTEVREGFDFHNTTVAFAVVWRPALQPDAIIVDYGLPVTIDVDDNDFLAGEPTGLLKDKPDADINKAIITDAGSQSLNLDQAEVSLMNGVITFTLKDANFYEPIVFYYVTEVEYYQNGELKTGNIYSSVTVYPASNITYEESFGGATAVYPGYEDVVSAEGYTLEWTTEGNAETAVQETQITPIAVGKTYNVFGYDEAYETDAGFSNGSAYKATVTMTGSESTSYALTEKGYEFTFTGTGFDVISECDEDTGMMVVMLYDSSNTLKKFYLVDTYFSGDKVTENGDGTQTYTEGIIANGNMVYQVPVVRNLDLTYGTYTVKVFGYLYNKAGTVADTVTYSVRDTAVEYSPEEVALAVFEAYDYDPADVEVIFMDENSVLNGGTGVEGVETELTEEMAAASVGTFAVTGETTVDGATVTTYTAYVYLDGFRVYQPANDAETLAAYPANEQGLSYNSIYKWADEHTDGSSIYYVERNGAGTYTTAAEYREHGPQNEIYLVGGDHKEGDTTATAAMIIGFADTDSDNTNNVVMISADSVQGTSVLGVLNGAGEFVAIDVLTTGTERFYDVSQYVVNNTLTIANLGMADESTGEDAVLSLNVVKTNLTVAGNTSGEVQQTAEVAMLALRAYSFEEPVIPEEDEEESTGDADTGADSGESDDKDDEDKKPNKPNKRPGRPGGSIIEAEKLFVPAFFEVTTDVTGRGNARYTALSITTSMDVDYIEIQDANGKVIQRLNPISNSGSRRSDSARQLFVGNVRAGAEDTTYYLVAYNSVRDRSEAVPFLVAARTSGAKGWK